jgi:hypothetical protein
MDWTCGSSARAPALKAQSPEFKPHPNKKKEKEKEKRLRIPLLKIFTLLFLFIVNCCTVVRIF